MDIELFPKQEEFFDLDKQINVFSGGIQSSKTTTGALRFLYHGLLAHKEKDTNFLIAADTYKTLSQATIPTFLKFARRFGKWNDAKAEFKTNWGTTVYARTATEPESAEGIPNVRRVWLDEGGKVSRYFFENLMGRAARLEAPMDITTTPYAMNWLASLCADSKLGKRDDVGLVHCKSIESPFFSKNEYQRQKRLLDPRRFSMKYDGEFGQMQGLVYDRLNLCKSEQLPDGTRYYGGVDWGYYPDPFVLTIRGVTPNGRHVRVAEYYRHYLIESDIVKTLQSYNGIYKFVQVFCDPSQPAHISALCQGGIPAVAADNEIRHGIDKHYELIKQERFWIFEDMNPNGVDEYRAYHYPEEKELGFDESRKVRETIPVDANNHGCDADRYVSVMLTGFAGVKRVPKAPDVGGPPQEIGKRIEWLKRNNAERYAQ